MIDEAKNFQNFVKEQQDIFIKLEELMLLKYTNDFDKLVQVMF